MKHILLKYVPAIALTASMLAMTSCTDLTETPFTEITDANFHPTDADLASLVGAAYTPQRAIWMGWYGMVDFQSETSDDLVTPVRPAGWYDGGTYIRLHEHRWDPNQGQPLSLWRNAYNGVNAANRVIYQIGSGVIPIDGDLEASTMAELRAMRAYYYSILLDNFGNVPIVTDFASTEQPVQSTRKEVYDFVVAELTETIPLLPAAVGVDTYGRLTKWGATGVLARVQLNAQVYTGTAHWSDVLTLTQQIIDSGLFQLDNRYRGPFARNNSVSPEIIYAVPYDAVSGTGSTFHMKTLKADQRFLLGLNGQPWGGISSAPQFVDTYQPGDKRLQDTWIMGDQYDAQGRGYTFVKHVKAIDESGCYCAGFPVRKYEIYAGQTGQSDVDYPALRYAEVLMMKAEALLRTGDAAGAAALVTQVRQRNFDDAATALVTGAQLQQGSSFNYGWYDTDGVVKTGPGGTPVANGGADIQYGRFLDELGWEFIAEGHRRQQLIRFGVFTTKSWFNHTPNGDFRTIFAIPQAALDTNPNLTQNPGY